MNYTHPADLVRAYTSGVTRARAAYSVENHCRHCGDLVRVASNRPERRECDDCRGKTR